MEITYPVRTTDTDGACVTQPQSLYCAIEGRWVGWGDGGVTTVPGGPSVWPTMLTQAYQPRNSPEKQVLGMPGLNLKKSSSDTPLAMAILAHVSPVFTNSKVSQLAIIPAMNGVGVEIEATLVVVVDTVVDGSCCVTVVRVISSHSPNSFWLSES